jgi:hypothetical protein
MQLSQNRYFQHAQNKNVIIKSSLKKGLHICPDTNPNNVEAYHLYLELIEGDSFVGMDDSNSFMVARFPQEGRYAEILEAWAKHNLYIDYNPFLLEHKDAAKLLSLSRDRMKSGQRLGQAIICELGDKTPTPNIEIWNSLSEEKILTWFYENCVIKS